MKIAPIDIRQQRFSVKFRGFDPQEVDSFLEVVADELEDLFRENGRLKENLKKLERDLDEFRATESDVKKTLLAAQTLKEEFSANAQKEAELILRDARTKANEILGSTKNAASGATEELRTLLRRKKQLVLNMRSMLETHLRMLEGEENEDALSGGEADTQEFGDAADEEPLSPDSLPDLSGPAQQPDPSLPVFIPGEDLDT